LNKLEKSTYNGNLKYLDLPSFYRYFIIQEFCGDIDSTFSSFNCHKKKMMINYILALYGIMIFPLIILIYYFQQIIYQNLFYITVIQQGQQEIFFII